jgi:hypothetical protein
MLVLLIVIINIYVAVEMGHNLLLHLEPLLGSNCVINSYAATVDT